MLNYTQATKNEEVTIVKLVSWQRWHKLEGILEKMAQIEEILERVDRDGGDRSAMPAFDDRAPEKRLPEEHVLHLACQNQATPRAIELLAARFPKSASSPEKKGRYPIHIACAKGLKPNVVDFLIRSHPQAVGVQDDFGKTPLHYVCESYAHNFSLIPSNAYRSPDRSLMAVVSLLLDRAPESPNVEDLYGMNAIEYAIDSDTNVSVVKLMQNASRDSWRTMKKIHRGKMSHEDLRRSLSSSFGSLNLSSANLNSSSKNLDGQHKEGKDNTQVSALPLEVNMSDKKVRAARMA
mmetsp:Transcript_4896/g.10535  ORF Transcript_4896/g.10535 Transcript_4896/m.10535 type:complete len:293 (+) Transcript_4896:80-958(+)